MTEPTGIALAIATLSAGLLAVLGVDYYALLWGLIGSAFAMLFFSAPMGRGRAALAILMGTLAGAGVGSFVADHSESRRVLILSCFICGAGAQQIVTAIINAGVARINRAAGKPEPGETPAADQQVPRPPLP